MTKQIMTLRAAHLVGAPSAKLKLNLKDCDGNIHAVLARAHKVLRTNGWTYAQRRVFDSDMKRGDYDTALQTLHYYFEVEI